MLNLAGRRHYEQMYVFILQLIHIVLLNRVQRKSLGDLLIQHFWHTNTPRMNPHLLYLERSVREHLENSAFLLSLLAPLPTSNSFGSSLYNLFSFYPAFPGSKDKMFVHSRTNFTEFPLIIHKCCNLLFFQELKQIYGSSPSIFSCSGNAVRSSWMGKGLPFMIFHGWRRI